MTVSGVVMAHPKRRGWAEELGDKLAIDVVWDRVNDRHETGLRCLQAGLDTTATHWLVVQDDAIVCQDLLAGLAAAVEVSGDRIVGLYVGKVRPQNRDVGARVEAARAARSSWLAMPGPWWGVGIVIPAVHLAALCGFFERSKVTNYDRRIATWAERAGVECWYTMPSLVEHRSGGENPSLVAGRPSQSRTARWFIGADVSALSVDWARPPAPVADWWRHTASGKTVHAKPGSPQARRYARTSGWEPGTQERCGECGGRKFVPLEAPCPV